MPKPKTDQLPVGTKTLDAPDSIRADVVEERQASVSTKSKGVAVRTVPASYKEGHASLLYSPKDMPTSDKSTKSK